jgi:hypothetical protein
MREELDFKEEEFDKARYTSEMIEYRNDALRKQLENVCYAIISISMKLMSHSRSVWI